MPTAESFDDGSMTFTISHFGATTRNTVGFQFLPWAYGTFRYSAVDDLLTQGQTFYDRSFDVHFQLRKESTYWPSIAVGLRDMLGTGLYSGEYLVATKTFNDRLKITGGLGWGRLATRNTVKNPLCFSENRFCTRPTRQESAGFGGTLSAGNWFRGDAGLFGGISYSVNDRLTLMAEISSDSYQEEQSAGIMKVSSPYNLGISYRLGDNGQLSGYYIQGSEVGIQLSYTMNPTKPRNAAGAGPVPPVLLPEDRVAVASWNLPDRDEGQPDAHQVLRQRLKDEGLRYEGIRQDGDLVILKVGNRRYDANAQAIGRANRALANTLPPEIQRFTVVLSRGGVPITQVTTARADLAGLEHTVDRTATSLARADIEDASDAKWVGNDALYPRFDYRLGPYGQLSYFDPEQPLRGDFGIQLKSSLILRPGLTLAGRVRVPIVGNIADSTRKSNSTIQIVRSDWLEYAQQSDVELSYLTAEYIWRPREDWFARVTAGYLEMMYGGVSAEMLWFPVKNRLALGGEINYAVKRDYDMLFGFQDYSIATGHASAYYNFGRGYLGQVDVGRYLAGDWGATFTVDREFNNGFKVGAFFTLTDVSFEDFGEGSFDKGVTLTIPISWFTGRPSKRVINETIRPILRDGGARLNVRNRLYGYTRTERGVRLEDRWGRYYR